MPRLPAGLGLDLAKLSVLSFRLTFNLTRENAREMAAALGVEEEALPVLHAVSHYTRTNRRHEVSAHFLSQRRNGPVSGVTVVFDLRPATYRNKIGFDELMKKTAGMELPSEAQCDLTFAFDTSEWRSAFTLPWKIFESDIVPFDEIKGVRVARNDGDTTLWSAILDRDDDVLMASIEYGYAGAWGERFFLEALGRGSEICNRLVVPASGKSNDGPD